MWLYIARVVLLGLKLYCEDTSVETLFDRYFSRVLVIAYKRVRWV